jgi:hypothetical protein
MQEDAKKMSRTIVVSTLLLFVLLGALTLAYGQTYEAKGGGVKVTVYPDKCTLKEITNLPLRATWTQDGKVIEGCMGSSEFGLLIFWFQDKTVVALPPELFKKVTGA